MVGYTHRGILKGRISLQYHYYQKTGAYHIATGAACQDAFLNTENEIYYLIALADGVSACKYGKTGAEKAVDALWDFIQAEGDNIFLYSQQKLTYLLIEHIMYYLELTAARENTHIKEYSSTLVFACIEKKTGRTIVGNLGDGSIFGFMQNALTQLSALARYTGTPFVTTSKYASKAMTVQYHDLSLGDCILLGSDGFSHGVRGIRGGEIHISEALKKFDFRELDGFLEVYPESDDCTYAAVRRTRE